MEMFMKMIGKIIWDGYGKLIEKNGTIKEGRFDCGEFVG
jgi:hypothetical protein